MLRKDSVIIACFKRGRACNGLFLRFSNLAVSLGITGLFAIGYPADVRAQTIFCPTTLPLTNGSCTNGVDGAFSHPSPLVTYASPAASAEQVCSPVNIALHERAHPVPKIEVQREDALSAHKALIGLRQQIVPLKCEH